MRRALPAGIELSPWETSTDIPIRRRRTTDAIACRHAQILGQIILVTAESSEHSTQASLAAHRLMEHLQEKPQRFLEAYQKLDPASQWILSHFLGGRWEEMLSLSEETDSVLFYTGLCEWGRLALHAKIFSLAGVVFQSLSEGNPSVSEAVRNRAQQAYGIMTGHGLLGGRVGFQLAQFFDHALDPGPIFGMSVAGAVASAFKLGFMTRFAARPAGFWTRGWAAGLRASALALPAEVTAFWAATRAVDMALRPAQVKWDADTP